MSDLKLKQEIDSIFSKFNQVFTVRQDELKDFMEKYYIKLFRGKQIQDVQKTDATEQMNKGAEETLRIARLVGAKEAIFKTNSAACGCGKIYDGTFSSVLIDGEGVVTVLLKKNGIKITPSDEA